MSDLIPTRVADNAAVTLSPDQALAVNTILTSGGQRVVFVTGKAGTGKSTVLRQVVQSGLMNLVVLAPTGLAALNVGGQTIHSFFGFKLGPLDDNPDLMHIWQQHGHKHKLVQKLEAIVIDEISMVRADLMDAIDFSLRTNLRSNQPFAGKTIIAFGDLWQLEPVVSGPAESEFIGSRYASPFFFDSRVVREMGMDVVELQTVHRQKDDQEFLWALNRIRRGETSDLDLFNSRVGAELNAEHVLTLTATNAKASTINMTALARLPFTQQVYEGQVSGDFGRDLPAEQNLVLKPGAQVMFVKNGKDWVNGTLGTVTTAEPDRVIVHTQDGVTADVVPESWEKYKYTFNRASERIEAEPVGSYSQIPLRLAWAVTIHKAQGLTFDNLRLDMDRRSFAHGQLYVALSRCRTLAGLSLVRPVTKDDVQVNPRIWEFERAAGLA